MKPRRPQRYQRNLRGLSRNIRGIVYIHKTTDQKFTRNTSIKDTDNSYLQFLLKFLFGITCHE